MLDACRQEVHDLHAFFTNWFTARVPDTDDVYARMASALHPDFALVSPGGELTAAAPLLAQLRSAYGCFAETLDEFRIEVAAIHGAAVADGVLLMTYEEWQTGTAHGTRGRQSSALFLADERAPNGVVWRHVHETWLPTASSPPP